MAFQRPLPLLRILKKIQPMCEKVIVELKHVGHTVTPILSIGVSEMIELRVLVAPPVCTAGCTIAAFTVAI